MKKVITLALVIIMLFSFTTTALANTNSIEPRDGFSWGFSRSDPSGGGGTYVTGQWSNKVAVLNVALNAIALNALSEKMLAAAGQYFQWTSVKLTIASYILAALTSVGALYVSQSKVFFKERVSPHSVLPGWYKKCEEIWYYDNEYTTVVPGSQNTYYVFKA